MSYTSAVEQLNAMVPELFTKPGAPRRKFSLAEIGLLLAELDQPQQQYPSILIAGTNGKGSTAATLASILQASGLRTGLYTSPHLERVNERIRVNGADISDDVFARHFFRVRQATEKLVKSNQLAQQPSFFETLTAIAFLHFAEGHIDLAVLEVGMGGRLDATNIVDPRLSVITDISLDHTEWLGSTIGAITREKAGILRPNGILVTMPQHPEANQAIGEVAVELNVRGVTATQYMPANGASAGSRYLVEILGAAIEVASPLTGAHQQRNIALAMAAAAELAAHHGFPITSATIAQGIRETRWPGRLERFHRGNTQWILDVAHNPAGAWALRSGLRETLEGAPTKVLVFGCLRDKPIFELAQILFPLFDRIILAPIVSPRAAAIGDLLAAAAEVGTPAEAASSIAEALDSAASAAGNGVIVVAGSVYLVGDARGSLLRGLQGENAAL